MQLAKQVSGKGELLIGASRNVSGIVIKMVTLWERIERCQQFESSFSHIFYVLMFWVTQGPC
jgi:hypothetical protein